MSSRPTRLILVTGTGTDIGKTWTTVRLVQAGQAHGLAMAARKPAQSFSPGDDAAGATDAQVLAEATGEEPHAVCPAHRWYPTPMAPPMAARSLDRPGFSIDDLVDELAWPSDQPAAVGLVETAGGVRSPLADDGDTVDVMNRIAPDAVVLVADAGLGTINAVRLSVDALTVGATTPGGCPPIFVVLNRFDDADELHRRNRDWLTRKLDLTCLFSHGPLDPILGLVASNPKRDDNGGKHATLRDDGQKAPKTGPARSK